MAHNIHDIVIGEMKSVRKGEKIIGRICMKNESEISVDFRVSMEDDNGEEFFTKKGIRISREEFAKFRELVENVGAVFDRADREKEGN